MVAVGIRKNPSPAEAVAAAEVAMAKPSHTYAKAQASDRSFVGQKAPARNLVAPAVGEVASILKDIYSTRKWWGSPNGSLSTRLTCAAGNICESERIGFAPPILL